jgi:hypothetical protein
VDEHCFYALPSREFISSRMTDFSMIAIATAPTSSRHCVKPLVQIGVAALMLIVACNARSSLFEEGDRIMLQAAPNVIHFNSDPEHADYSWLVGVEWQSASRWLAGAAYFNNSFDQKSQYFYFGKSWPLDFIVNNAYFKLTGGLLLGYKEPYEDKIPFNHNGVAIAGLPALGYQYGDFNVQLNLLGTAGIMFTFGYDIIQW